MSDDKSFIAYFSVIFNNTMQCSAVVCKLTTKLQLIALYHELPLILFLLSCWKFLAAATRFQYKNCANVTASLREGKISFIKTKPFERETHRGETTLDLRASSVMAVCLAGCDGFKAFRFTTLFGLPYWKALLFNIDDLCVSFSKVLDCWEF